MLTVHVNVLVISSMNCCVDVHYCANEHNYKTDIHVGLIESQIYYFL